MDWVYYDIFYDKKSNKKIDKFIKIFEINQVFTHNLCLQKCLNIHNIYNSQAESTNFGLRIFIIFIIHFLFESHVVLLNLHLQSHELFYHCFSFTFISYHIKYCNITHYTLIKLNKIYINKNRPNHTWFII